MQASLKWRQVLKEQRGLFKKLQLLPPSSTINYLEKSKQSAYLVALWLA